MKDLVMKIVQVYVPEDCLSGVCDCKNASECKFKRCANCDNIMDDKGNTLDTAWAEEHNRCPDCGGAFHQ